MIAVLVPVLARPHNAAKLVESIQGHSTIVTRIVFLCSPGDDDEIAACRATGAEVVVVDWPVGKGDYARKINHGLRVTDEPWIFQAADDLRFGRGWDERAVEFGDHRCVGVVGTNDLGNPMVRRGRESTHSLVRRAYVEGEGATFEAEHVVMHEGYWHNFVDRELVEHARRVGCFDFCRGSRVEHLHPHWRKGAMDRTYEIGQKRYNADRRLFTRRSARPRRRPGASL